MAHKDPEWRKRKAEKQREYYQRNHDEILARARARHARNREKQNAKSREYAALNRGRARAYKLRLTHGMYPEEWAAMWEAQNGHCYLGGEDLSLCAKVSVDHDHSCCPGRQSCANCHRGLACDNCNMAVGLAEDSPAKLRRMADALEAAQLAVQQRKAAAVIQDPLFSEGEACA